MIFGVFYKYLKRALLSLYCIKLNSRKGVIIEAAEKPKMNFKGPTSFV